MKRNLAGALGAWSARHRKTAILGWLLFVVLAAVIGGAAGQKNLTNSEQGARDSSRALKILEDAGLTTPAGEVVLVHSGSITADDPKFRAAVDALVSGVQGTGKAQDVTDPYQANLISTGRHDALVQFKIRGDPETASDRVQPVLDAVQKVRSANHDLTIAEYGEASGDKLIGKAVDHDFKIAEWTAVPLALGILLIAFGALLAAILPVLLAMTAFVAAMGVVALTSHTIVPQNDSTNSVMLLIGLAVGVDYCLFYLRREREERASGRDRETALRIAAATSGRSVLVSGMTVIVAMSGMFLSGMKIFEGFALGTIIVVAIAMIGSVTVLPALLSLLGDRVEFGRIPGLSRLRRPTGGSKVWAAILRVVLSRPGVSALVAAGVLAVLAAPALGMRTQKLSIDQQLPASNPLVSTFKQVTTAFPHGPDPARVVVKADDVTAAPVQQAIDDLKATAQRTGEYGSPIEVKTYADKGVAEIEIPLAGDGNDAKSVHALKTLRETLVPDTLGRVDGVEAVVGGDLAFGNDFNDQLRSSILPVFLFVLGITFLLMLISFRSVVIAATSIGLNLLSVGAAYGVMVAMFQHGWGASLVGSDTPGAIESWIPLFVFVVLFGLSMDYHVFVVSRIREARDKGMPTTQAVAHGIRTTAGVVTSAAIIMIAVFSIFGTLSMQDFKQLGVGLAVAVFLDATIVRAVLLPSVMTLLGERNWYLPRWLNWLPELSHGAETEAAPEPEYRPLAPTPR
jgi:RND superfamily putative drug exporter